VSAPLHPAPALDPELGRLREEFMRKARSAAPSVTAAEELAEELIAGRAMTSTEHVVPASDGAPALAVTVFRRTGQDRPRPVLLHFHGGAMIKGDRFTALGPMLDWIEALDVILVTVEYRLAPQSSPTVLVDDCHRSLVWLAANAGDLEADPGKMVLVGSSAGGGLVAGVALMARDQGEPTVLGQMLLYPMLDDRGDTVSNRQLNALGPERSGNIDAGWDALLGDRRGTDAVSPYAAPARARDLSGLPPTFIEVGASEGFRDEAVAFASSIWAHGGQAELHVWPGAFHAYDVIAPTARISRQARQVRTQWLERLLNDPSKMP
jgi:acetyl esterase/lipase